MATISNLDKYKGDLEKLISSGELLHYALQHQCHPDEFEKSLKKSLNAEKYKTLLQKLPSFKGEYQTWYSEARALIKQLLPDRVADFVKLYEKPKTRKDINFENYVIEDSLQGLSITKGGWEKQKVVGPEAAIPGFQQQLNILKACQKRFESSLFDIRQMVQADLFDSELGAARELLKHKFFRAAGAIAGVVLEKHLAQVCDNHNLSLTKRHPTINDFNELLKQNDVVDTPQWRFIQHLGDLRNLCDHNKDKEPTDENINDLVDGVEKITRTLF